MPSIGIADKTTLDAIKTKVDNNLDASILSRAPASTALSSAIWTSARASKLDNLDASITSARKRTYYGEFTCPANTTLTTALSLSGDGALIGLTCYNGTGHSFYCKLVIDGTVVSDKAYIGVTYGRLCLAVAPELGLMFSNASVSALYGPIMFKTSLLLQVHGESEGGTTFSWCYNL